MARKPMLQVFKPPHFLSSPLRQYFSNGVGKDLSLLRSNFPKDWSVYIMGGLLRNLLVEELRGLPINNADIDLVVNGANSSSELRESVRDYCIRQNEFGGAKCQISRSGVIFDVWRIEDHVGMSSTAKPHTVEQLLKHNLLDVDAVLLDAQTEYLYDYGCVAAIQRGRVSLLGPEGISKEFAAAQVAHITLIAFKTGFQLADDALQFIRDVCERTNARSEVLRIAHRKAPEEYGRIEKFLNGLLKEELWPVMTS